MSTPAPATCFATPGWYCTASNVQLFCPADWYCPGGLRPPVRCPAGKWAAVGSMYIEDCSDHMNVELALIIALIIMLFALGLCCWWSQYQYRGSVDDNPFAERQPRYFFSKYGSMGQTNQCYPQPVLGVPMHNPYRNMRMPRPQV